MLPLWVILFRHPLLCSERLCKQDADKWKGEGSYLLVLAGTCKLLGWAPARSVLLVKAPKEEGLAFISPWNGLIISLAGFLSPDSLVFFCTVLYLFRSIFFLLNFQASYCRYLNHHSFFSPLFLSQMVLCTLSRLFLTTETIFSKVWAKDTWLCHFRIRPYITDSWTPRSRHFEIKAPETRMSTEEDY